MNISISRDGMEIGEWTEEEIQTLLEDGKLLPTDYYWMQGMTEWQEIATSIKPPPPAPESESDGDEQARVGINRLTYIGIIAGWWIIAAFLCALIPDADGDLDLFAGKVLQSVKTGLDASKPIKFKVVARGDHIEVYLNDEASARIDVHDSSFSDG
jgi:hypothetical protein